MPCCSRKKTDGIEPQPIDRNKEKSAIDSNNSSNSGIDYSITIKTGNYDNSTTNGPVYIKIFGRDNKQTEDLLLTNSPNDKSFQSDSIKKFSVKGADIGKPHRIIIRHEDNENEWFIDYVEISVHNFLIRFVANRWLSATKHDQKLSVELFGSEQPAALYNVEVQTGSEQIEPLDSPVYIQIHGTTTRTPKIFLEPKDASFTKDSTVNFDISSNNVGEIQKIVIGHEGTGTVNDWYLKNVKVQTSAEQQKFTVNKWLSKTKGDQKLFVELNRNAISPPEIYSITIRTADVQRIDTIENIEMSIHGSNGHIDKILLKDHVKSNQQKIFQKGSLDEFEIEDKDIGDIESITIGFNDDEQIFAWLLESIDIKYKETVYRFQTQCWLSSRLGSNFSWITIKPDTNNDNINYKVIIETGDSKIDANVILCIYGDKDTTKNLALRTTKDGTSAKFNKDSRLEFDLKDIDVGKIQKINIGHDGKDDEQRWFLKSIEIEKNDEYYLFKAYRWLSEEQENFIDLLSEETLEEDQILYRIKIITSSEDDSGTDSNVFMKIYGENDQTKRFQLITTEQDSKLLFKKGKTDKFDIKLNDVGNIQKINIAQDGKGLHPVWHLKTVEIQKGTEFYKFNADEILDLSMLDVDLTPMPHVRLQSPKPIKPETPPKSIIKVQETMYEVLLRFDSRQETPIDDDNSLYMIIFGVNGQTKKMPLLLNKNGETEFKTNDVGKISKIILGQDETKHQVIWHVDNIIIKRGNEITTFNVERSIEQNTQIELTPSPIRKPSETPTIGVETKARPSSKKQNDIDYEIKTTTGEKSFDGKITFKIRGELGIITIPLTKTKTDAKPFQSKATDEFLCRTNDVGKLRRIIIEYNGTKNDNVWHLKKLQIIKGNEIYNFNTNIRLDYHENKVTLYPNDQRKEDFVQTELRRLRENLHSESLKLRRPLHKAHEPFVYNDLRPYFDTSTVEKAIHEPLETPNGYYTRLTALRIVEPWEAYGMDYGVNYELLKQRRYRTQSAKRSLPTQNGMMILPPLSLPFGGQITYVNPAKSDRSRSSVSSKRRSSSKHNDSIDRTQGSTHLPEFPCVAMQKPAAYQRTLTLNDVSKIRSFLRTHHTLKADYQKEKDYKRTHDDFYRMKLDNAASHTPINRDNMVRVYHSYLGTTPGSKKAVRDLCDQIPLNATKTTVETTV
ncbi:unnamed protein product [Rotaria sordida]|uniref:PLAT domain-containing protein n=1 Tax=Rotaria sordida TaxID=392033 RepID=A0A814LFN7_9BILA|nr:unnamed protein product [Rotaria sordida]